MSNVGLIIEERSRDIGDFLVGRLIPFRKKRMIGPFIFIDHMGPTKLGPKKYMDVDQHPHIVNWMTSGSGVSHTERTPKHLRNGKEFTAHGYQIWVALPKEHEEIAPSFNHIPSEKLPKWEENGTSFTLVAGEGYGRKSPVPTFSPLFMVELKTTNTYQLDVHGKLKGEIGICIVEGSIKACDEEVLKGNILVSKVEDVCKIEIQPNSHILLFGGEPFKEECKIYWNFVSSSQEKIEKAKTAWKNKTFPMMDSDTSYVPLPGL